MIVSEFKVDNLFDTFPNILNILLVITEVLIVIKFFLLDFIN